MRLNTIPQTAQRLGCSRKHVYNLISAGKLKPTDISLGPRSRTRISDDEIDRYITEATREVPVGGVA